MTAKDLEDLEYFKSLLLEKRTEVLQSKVIEMSAVEQNANSGLLKYPTHLADLGSDTWGQDLSSYFNARTGKYLKHLDDALRRIENGSYSICVDCGGKIHRERLEVVPHTRYCISCKAKNRRKLSIKF